LRNRILLGSGLLILLPLLLLSLGIRAEMQRRLGEQYNERIVTLMTIIQEDLDARAQAVRQRLTNLHRSIDRDNAFRHAIADDDTDRRVILDYAAAYMGLMGLDMLQIQDHDDRIISSGHYRNEFDRVDAGLPALLAASPGGTALVLARRPQAGAFVALAAADSIRLGGRLLHIVGGISVDTAFLRWLTRDRALAVSLVHEHGVISSDESVQHLLQQLDTTDGDRPLRAIVRAGNFVQARDLPFIAGPAPAVDGAPTPGPAAGQPSEPAAWQSRSTTARLLVSHPAAPLRALLNDLNLWLALVFVSTLAGTFVFAFWSSRRISRPLDELARQTAALDLDRLDTTFPTERTDEIGVLSRFLAAMTRRLRASVSRLRDAERRATIGEVARQVNHDLRNGLTPIRNVLRHLSQLAADHPEELAPVFRQRQRTLTTGLAYLEELATNYARLSPPRQRSRCDLNAVVREVVSGLFTGDESATVTLELVAEPPPVLADPIGLRRITDNLVRNAIESLEGRPGTITVRTTVVPAGAGAQRQFVLTVADTGVGIPPEDQERIFNDFYTTKQGGNGLGLSNVRRLVSDCEGTIELTSELGGGTVFTVNFPSEEDPA